MKSILLIVLSVPAILFISGCTVIDPGANAAKLPPVINLFTVNPPGINAGESALLSWDVSNADTVSVEPGSVNLPASGAAQVVPGQTTDYTISATNKFGTSTMTLSLAVIIPPPAPKTPTIISFSAKPERVAAGIPVELSWNVADADSISIEIENGQSQIIAEESGSIIVQPVTATLYTLKVSNSNGITSKDTMVTIKQDAGYFYGKCS